MLMRHGKSDWSDSSFDDFERPLSQRGKKAARCMGQWLLENNYLPDCIISSTAKRARKTASHLLKGAEMDDSIVELDDTLYTSLAEHILMVVHSGNNDFQKLMLIGHDSGMEDLAMELADDSIRPQANGKIMPTASIAIFDYHGSKWHKLNAGNVDLIDVIRPKEIDC